MALRGPVTEVLLRLPTHTQEAERAHREGKMPQAQSLAERARHTHAGASAYDRRRRERTGIIKARCGRAQAGPEGQRHLDDVSRLTEAVHRQVPQLRARQAPGR